MLKSTDILFIITFALEATIIIIGNTFTIFVFWTQRSHLKRTCFLLINLAIADLLVGIAEPIVLGTEKIPKMKVTRVEDLERIPRNLSSTFQILGSCASVIFLALISLEHVHAVLCMATPASRNKHACLRVYHHFLLDSLVMLGWVNIAADEPHRGR